MRVFFILSFGTMLCFVGSMHAQFRDVEIEYQPFISATERLLEALEFVGAPLSEKDEMQIRDAIRSHKSAEAMHEIESILDQYVVAKVNINPESRVKVSEGNVEKDLVQQGWRTFLVKVENEAGITARLVSESPNAAPQFKSSSGSSKPKKEIFQHEIAQRFLDIKMFDAPPLKLKLSGLALEYRIIQLFSRDVGKREASLSFNVGQGTQDLGFRNSVPILFRCLPATKVMLKISDWDGNPTSAAFVIRDEWGRIYPNPARRLAPDFFFHNQVYRADGESILLPSGNFTIEVSRGPEYRVQKRKLIVKKGSVNQTIAFQLERWIHPKSRGWISGDHHVHAAGCAHYEDPTEGVSPSDMMRHILGEDLNVGCVLSWGPCWYSQKNFFEGRTSSLSKPNYLMRYDVEVSGFPSSHSGHLCLLRLIEDDYPETTRIEEWPSWTLPILKWAKEQGGIVGYSHSGWGLALPDYENGKRVWRSQTSQTSQRSQSSFGKRSSRAADILPDYEVPAFDGIGANEYIVSIAHDLCDFISAVDTPPIWELNIWYHTLNCGFRARISGETDFPCIYGDKVGLGRVYVKLKPDQSFTFDNWVEGLKEGRSYCGDGMSHIFDFKINDVELGEVHKVHNEIEDHEIDEFQIDEVHNDHGEFQIDDLQISQLDLDEAQKVRLSFEVAAFLKPKPTKETEAIRNRRLDEKPYWHIERARIGDTRKVPVEIIVNGFPVFRREIIADGKTLPMELDLDISHSSWVAIRIFPSIHTNPIFVKVAGKPIRASRRSAEWCVKAVEACWKSKRGRIRKSERAAAKNAYDRAKEIYARIFEESNFE